MKHLHDKTTVENDTLTKLINGKRYPLTIEEIENQKTLTLEIEKQYLMDDWHVKMQESDQKLRRVEEDIITQMGLENFSEHIQKTYNEKLSLRQKRPNQ